MYAGFWKRTAAYVIDFIILVAASYVLFLSIGLIAALAGSNVGNGAVGTVYGLFVFIIALFGPIIYFAAFESSKLRATPGKLALGIKVTDMAGAQIGFWRAAGRNLGKIVSGLVLYIGFVMAGFTQRRQALHDKFAGTLVLDKNADAANLQPAQPQPAWLIAACIFAALIPFILIVLVLSAASMPEYTEAVEKSRMTQALMVMDSAAGAQERYRLKSADNRYAADFSQLDTEVPASDENFTYTLNPNAITARRTGGRESYTITKCYSTGRFCYNGSSILIEGLAVAPPETCCR
jgi:uncharacterized RDD family membrane protein YckC/Tfp pilus assembly protein PilE